MPDPEVPQQDAQPGEVVATADMVPQPGESLEQFAQRAGLDLNGKDAARVVKKAEDFSSEEIAAALEDPGVPPEVKQYWLRHLYGRGGGGRRASKQERLQTQQVLPGRRYIAEKAELRRVPGKERKRMRRVWRAMGNTIRSAGA